MSAISGSGGAHYISDGEIMAWLATTQGNIYDDLQTSMDLSSARAHMTDALVNIKAELQAANDSKDFKQVDADLQAFMTTYGSNPDFSEACKGLAPLADRIHSDVQAHSDFDAAHAEWETKNAEYQKEVAASPQTSRGFGIQQSNTLQKPVEPQEPEATHYSDDQIHSWNTLIDGKTDGASKNDQLTMIHIQELKATLDQSSQLGSTFISSGDKTNSAIINNIA
jgi:hypothetical protein